MHVANNIPPYSSAVDAISKFPETATALGVKLDYENKLKLTAPHGIKDVINMVVKPTPFFRVSKDRMMIFEKRVSEKKWQSIWNQIEVIESFNVEKERFDND